MRPGALSNYLCTLQMSDLLPQRFRAAMLERAGARIGAGAYLKAGLRLFHPENLEAGHDVFLNFDVYIDASAPVRIGDYVDIGDHVRLVTSTHEFGVAEKRAGQGASRPIVIGSGTWIGSSVVVLPGVSIGPGCVIGAGAVVTRDCAPDGVYAGVPARRVRDLDPAEVRQR